MSEATAATPAPEPPTLRDLVAAHNALVAEQNALVAAGNAEMAALRRSLDAAKLSPGRQVSDNAIVIAASRYADGQVEARQNAQRIADSADAIRQAAMMGTLMEAREARQAAPAPEPARPRRQPGKRTAGAHRRLSAVQAVKGFAPVAAFGAALKAARPALKPAAAALRHPAQHLLAASLPVKAVTAAGVMTLTVAGAVAVVPNATLAHPFGAPSARAGAPGWGTYAAVPIQHPDAQQLRTRVAVTRPKPALDAKSSGTNPVSSAPWYGSAPSASSSPSQQASQQQEQAPPPQQQQQQQQQSGPATLGVTLDSGLDLSAIPAVTLTISASGSGWAHWRVDAGGTDLNFSAMHGVLQAGETATLTITADPPTDGLTMQTFTVAGQQYTVTLPLPLPQVVVTPTATPSLPTDSPSDPPSSGD